MDFSSLYTPLYLYHFPMEHLFLGIPVYTFSYPAFPAFFAFFIPLATSDNAFSIVCSRHLSSQYKKFSMCVLVSPSICVIVSLSVNYVDVWNFPMSLLCILPFLTTSSGYLIKKLLPKQGGVPRYILRTFEPR